MLSIFISCCRYCYFYFCFFFNDTATTEIYTLSLHDALPISSPRSRPCLWHPFADMSSVAGHEVVLVRGDGCHVWDADGARYIDASAGLWYCNVGHGRLELARAAARQMEMLA